MQTNRIGLLVLVLGAGLAAQEKHPSSKPDQAAITAALDAWMSARNPDEKLLKKTLEVVVDANRVGFRAVAKLIRSTPETKTHARRSLNGLLQNIAVEFLKRNVESGMVFDGQYDPIAELQPFVGRFYITLMVDTPAWFPDSDRTAVVPALRDLFPKGPDPDAIDAIREIAEDRDFEPEVLRNSLAFALAQWGHREFVQRRLKSLRSGAGDSSLEEQLPFTRDLAHTHYLLREYDQAASWWLKFLRSSERQKVTVTPDDYYNAGCSLSLAGQVGNALDELERCTGLMRSGHADESTHIDESLFKVDPDLRAVRSTKRFEKLVDRAFGKREGGGEDH